MLFLKNPIFLRICHRQTGQAKSNNSSKYHSMAALFRPLLTLPSASNPCSNSAVKVVRTCPLKKSSVNQRFLRPVICDLSMAAPLWRIPVGHLQFWALSSISCFCDPICCSSCLADLHLFLGVSLVPCGFEKKAWLVTISCSFLRFPLPPLNLN